MGDAGIDVVCAVAAADGVDQTRTLRWSWRAHAAAVGRATARATRAVVQAVLHRAAGHASEATTKRPGAGGVGVSTCAEVHVGAAAVRANAGAARDALAARAVPGVAEEAVAGSTVALRVLSDAGAGNRAFEDRTRPGAFAELTAIAVVGAAELARPADVTAAARRRAWPTGTSAARGARLVSIAVRAARVPRNADLAAAGHHRATEQRAGAAGTVRGRAEDLARAAAGAAQLTTGAGVETTAAPVRRAAIRGRVHAAVVGLHGARGTARDEQEERAESAGGGRGPGRA